MAGGGEPGQRQRPSALGPRRHPDRAGRARAGPGPGVLAGGGARPRVRHVSPGLLLHRQRGQTLRVGLRDGARDWTQVTITARSGQHEPPRLVLEVGGTPEEF